MAKHLILELYDLYRTGTQAHPMEDMQKLGITYQDATPQSIGDCWQFWNCENIPDPLPTYLRVFKIDIMEMVGYGLSKERAEQIRDYKIKTGKPSK